MTVTHASTQPESASDKPAKRTRTKSSGSSKKPETQPTNPVAKPAAEQPSAPSDQGAKAPKRGKSKRPIPLITMKLLGERYIQHLAESGKSQGTALSYLIEITTATKFMGEDTPISTLTPDDVRRFNDSKQVMLLRSGKPKAPPSYLKTQRVLRLALVWAAEQGWIETAPLPQ